MCNKHRLSAFIQLFWVSLLDLNRDVCYDNLIQLEYWSRSVGVMSNTNKVSVFSPPWRDIYGMQYVFGQKIEHGVNLHYELTRSGPGVSGKTGFAAAHFLLFS